MTAAGAAPVYAVVARVGRLAAVMTIFEISGFGDAVSVWRPGLLEFLEAMQAPTGWTFDAGGFGAGIDNVHVDVHLSPRFRELTVQVVRNLIAEDLSASAHQAPVQLVSAADLEQFRRRYMRLFESALERDRSALSAELLVLLQLALLRWLLGVAERENRVLQQEYQHAQPASPLPGEWRRCPIAQTAGIAQTSGPRHQPPRAQALVPPDSQAGSWPAEQVAQFGQHGGLAAASAGILQSGADGAGARRHPGTCRGLSGREPRRGQRWFLAATGQHDPGAGVQRLSAGFLPPRAPRRTRVAGTAVDYPRPARSELAGRLARQRAFVERVSVR